jgi:uncharacterized membrane protein YtjA (UPF0391 family)
MNRQSRPQGQIQLLACATFEESRNKGGQDMLYWTVICLIIALIAGVLGFGGIAGAATGIAQILFFIFLVLLVISVASSIFRGRGPKP